MADAIPIEEFLELNGTWPGDVPHKLAGQTLLDGAPVRRRVVVHKRKTLGYLCSTVTQDNGVFEFTHLPTQTLSDPYTVTCYDESESGWGNAMIFDRVYQVDDYGNPPAA